MYLPQLMTAQEVATYLGLQRGTIYSLVSRGEIDSHKYGRSRRFTIEQVKDYVQRSRTVEIVDMTGNTR